MDLALGIVFGAYGECTFDFEMNKDKDSGGLLDWMIVEKAIARR